MRKDKRFEGSSPWPITAVIAALIPLAAAISWLTPASFIPVPWPDDSAFYFVARELFRWPPRWVMLPQAPFEPTYRIFNFNTMPLYPILIGLGRWFGIDGIFALKLWPLGAYAASGAWLVWRLGRAGMGPIAGAAVSLAFALDPSLHWASVLARPESLIGLFGMALVLRLTFGEHGDTRSLMGSARGPARRARRIAISTRSICSFRSSRRCSFSRSASLHWPRGRRSISRPGCCSCSGTSISSSRR